MLAALFDLDGTLLDSLGVWEKIDREFFAANGLVMPENYAASISGLSFMQTAEYTKEHFGLGLSAEEIARIWHDMCREEYAEHVLLKPCAGDYLLRLKRAGRKLAVVTTLTRELYEPVLRRNGVYDCFDTFATTDETGLHKRTGEVYLLAASRLNVPARECAVFEDIYEGMEGARQAGMCACLVYDKHNKRLALSKQLCDYYIETYKELTLWT